MLTSSSAPPSSAWVVGGPSGYQMSSHTLTPTMAPSISNTGRASPARK